MKKILSITFIALLLFCLFSLVSCGGSTHSSNTSSGEEPQDDHLWVDGICSDCGAEDSNYVQKYENAKTYLSEGKHEEAYKILSSLGNFKDTQNLLKNFKTLPTRININHYEVKKEFSIIETRKFQYDSKGQIEKLVTTLNGEDYTYTFAYDEKGNLVQEIYTPPYTGNVITEFTYDESGKLIHKKEIEQLGDTTDFDYTYDENGRVVRIDTLTRRGVAVFYAFVYDEKGNMTEEIIDTFQHHYHTYDEKGNRIKTVFDKIITEYQYDDNDNLLKITTTKPSSLIPSQTVEENFEYIYENGILAGWVDNTKSDRTFTAHYVYDANQNLVKVTTENTVEYYDTTIDIEYTHIYAEHELLERMDEFFDIEEMVSFR